MNLSPLFNTHWNKTALAVIAVGVAVASIIGASFFVSIAEAGVLPDPINSEGDPFTTPTGKIGICHYDSEDDKFVSNAPNLSSIVDGTGHGGHAENIIPAFFYDLGDGVELYPGQHWDAEGAALLHNGCSEPEPEPNSSLRICKIIVDSEGNIVDGTDTDAEFYEDVFGPSIDETVTFTTPLSLNTDLVDDNGDSDDAQCFLYDELKAGKYTYDVEGILPGSATWGTPLYHDYFDETPLSTSDFYELTVDGEEGDEDNADGVINLGEDDERTLAIVNTLIVEEEPELCTVTIYSDTTNTVVEKDDATAEALSFIHSAWTAVIDGATWIWGDDPVAPPVNGVVQTFENSFGWNGPVTSATLTVAADNSYVATLNESEAGADAGEFNYNLAGQDEYDVAGLVETGVNELSIAVTNKPGSSNPAHNPAGLLYKLTVTGTDPNCNIPPEEPPQCVPELEGGWSDTVEDHDQGLTKAGGAVSAGRSDPEIVPGEPNWTPGGSTGFYSLGFGGWIIVAFDSFVPNVEGDDISIHEATNGTYPLETALIEVSQNGADWFEVGTADNNGVSYFDFDSTGLSWIKYVRITDTTDKGLHSDNADGFDLDAVDATQTVCDEPHDPDPEPHQCEIDVELLKNGGFEAPEVTHGSHWDIFPSGTTGLEWMVEWITGSEIAPEVANLELQENGLSSWLASGGTQWAELDSDWNGHGPAGPGPEEGSVAISQTVWTEIDATYTASFDFSPRPGTAEAENKVEVLVNGVVKYTAGPAATAGELTEWSSHSFDFVADSEDTTLTFRDAGTPNNTIGTFIDEASLVCSAEPHEDAPYCGDGEINQEWEQCDGGESCTAWCQPVNQCTEDIFAHVVVDDFSNTGSGDVTDDIFLGQGVTSIPNGTWFPVVLDGSPVIDPAISGYEDVPGVAVERSADGVTVLLYGSQTKNDVEHVEGYVEFSDNSSATSQTGLPSQDKLEKEEAGEGSKGGAGNDEVWLDGGLSHFWLTTTTADDGYTTGYADAPQCGAKIIAHKIICTDESELPNWGTGGPTIDVDTAQDWVDTYDSCEFASDWEFEWGPSNAGDPGDTLVGYAGGAWTPFGPTDVDGMTMTTIPSEDLESKLWFREVLKDGYIPFTHGPNGGNSDDFSAEFYCHTDVLNYDNYDRLDGAVEGETYYCVGWNHAIPDDPNDAHLTIHKETDFGDGEFDFTISGFNFFDELTLITENGSAWSNSISLAPGTYSVLELVPEGWFYDSENSYCEYDGDSEGIVVTNGHEITVEEGEYISCYFYNDKDQSCPDGYFFNEESGQCEPRQQGEAYSDLSVEKIVDDSEPAVGEQVTFTVSLTNNGPDVAGAIVISDLLPSGVTYVSHTASNGDENYDETTGEWTLLSLGVDVTATLEITVTIKSGEEGQTIINSAFVESNDNLDENSSNDSDSASVTVESGGDNGNGGGNGDPDPTPPGGGPTGLGGALGGLVLGASTGGEVLGETCGLYMGQHLRRDFPENSVDQVIKLQEFLNKHGFGPVEVTGQFGAATEEAVKRFQAAYGDQILVPWNIDAPTGLVYLTTLRQINLIECPHLVLQIPELVVWSISGPVNLGTLAPDPTPEPEDGKEEEDDSEEDESQTASVGDAVNGDGSFWSDLWNRIFGR